MRNRGVLHLDGWEQQACLVVGETPKRYRICALPGGELRLPKGRNGLAKIFYPGTHLVPKHMVVLDLMDALRRALLDETRPTGE